MLVLMLRLGYVGAIRSVASTVVRHGLLVADAASVGIRVSGWVKGLLEWHAWVEAAVLVWSCWHTVATVWVSRVLPWVVGWHVVAVLHRCWSGSRYWDLSVALVELRRVLVGWVCLVVAEPRLETAAVGLVSLLRTTVRRRVAAVLVVRVVLPPWWLWWEVLWLRLRRTGGGVVA